MVHVTDILMVEALALFVAGVLSVWATVTFERAEVLIATGTFWGLCVLCLAVAAGTAIR